MGLKSKEQAGHFIKVFPLNLNAYRISSVLVSACAGALSGMKIILLSSDSGCSSDQSGLP